MNVNMFDGNPVKFVDDEIKAYQKGFSAASNLLFIDYPKGNGIPEYSKEILKLCLDSASVGNVNAITCLGYIYEKGLCEQENMVEAVKWYLKSNEKDQKQNKERLIDELLNKLDNIGLEERYLIAEMLYYDKRNYKDKALTIFNNLSLLGYQKAKIFLENNY